MMVPLKPKYTPLIVEDLLETYKGRYGLLSLKTLWLMLREQSRPLRNRDDEAMILFCGSNQELANLTFGASYDELNIALKNVLKVELVPMHYWIFIKMLATRATKQQWRNLQYGWT